MKKTNYAGYYSQFQNSKSGHIKMWFESPDINEVNLPDFTYWRSHDEIIEFLKDEKCTINF